MTFGRYLRIWRQLNAVTIHDIANDLNIPENKVRTFDATYNNEIVMQWYLDHGLKLEDYADVKEKYKKRKEKEE